MSRDLEGVVAVVWLSIVTAIVAAAAWPATPAPRTVPARCDCICGGEP